MLGVDGMGGLALTVWVKISANWHRTLSWASAIGAKGAVGCGLRRASVSCAAASQATFVEGVVGMLYRYGKNSTVRAMRSDLVLGM